ncbi:hypothetical protein Dimus_006170 [Dionaea muscipula]
MELIKRQRWENLFKKRKLVHVDAVKEFYAKLTVIHLKKKDVVKSSVKGIGIEFDHEKLATILGVPGKNGIYEYIKDVWEESKYMKPLEITRRVANNETLTAARRVKSGEMKPFQRFIHFPVMKNVVPRFGKRDTSSFMDPTYMDHSMARRENGVWWMGSGENRRRDDDMDNPEEEAEKEDEGNKDGFDWEAVIDEAAIEGESGSGEKFYDAEDKDQGSPEVQEETQATTHKVRLDRRNKVALLLAGAHCLRGVSLLAKATARAAIVCLRGRRLVAALLIGRKHGSTARQRGSLPAEPPSPLVGRPRSSPRFLITLLAARTKGDVRCSLLAKGGSGCSLPPLATKIPLLSISTGRRVALLLAGAHCPRGVPLLAKATARAAMVCSRGRWLVAALLVGRKHGLRMLTLVRVSRHARRNTSRFPS